MKCPIKDEQSIFLRQKVFSSRSHTGNSRRRFLLHITIIIHFTIPQQPRNWEWNRKRQRESPVWNWELKISCLGRWCLLGKPDFLSVRGNGRSKFSSSKWLVLQYVQCASSAQTSISINTQTELSSAGDINDIRVRRPRIIYRKITITSATVQFECTILRQFHHLTANILLPQKPSKKHLVVKDAHLLIFKNQSAGFIIKCRGLWTKIWKNGLRNFYRWLTFIIVEDRPIPADRSCEIEIRLKIVRSLGCWIEFGAVQ